MGTSNMSREPADERDAIPSWSDFEKLLSESPVVSDVGTTIVDSLYEDLQIDAEWSERTRRSFTWWAHRLPQHVWATDPVDQDGFWVVRVNAETDVFRIERSDLQDLAPALEAAATFATMSAFVWSEGVLRLRCGMVVHEELQPFAAAVLKLAVLDQVVHAEGLASTIPECEPAHGGARSEPDEMLGALEALPGMEGPSAWSGDHIEQLAGMLTARGVLATGDERRLTAEFPFGPDGGSAGVGGNSNMLKVTTEEVHPRLGAGLLMRLHLRSTPTLDGRELTPLELNGLEAGSDCDAHLLGSWCSSPDGGAPVFVSFFPNVLAGPESLLNLIMSMGMRSIWVSQYQ